MERPASLGHIWYQLRTQNGSVEGRHGRRPAPHQDNRIGALQSVARRLPKRASRNKAAVAETQCSVDDNDRGVLVQLKVLKAVVHDDDIGAKRLRESCSRGDP
jgi:hypothetical protein